MVFELLFEKFNKFYEKLFYNYGIFISRYYAYVICFSFIVNLIFTFGVLKLVILKDTDDLFMLTDSEAIRDERFVKKLFNNTEAILNDFYVHQLLDLGTGGEINFYVKQNPKLNILEKQYLDEISNINKLIRDNVKFQLGNRTYEFDDVCAKRYKKCWVEGTDLLSDRFLEHLKTQSLNLRKESSEIQFEEREETDMEFYYSTNGITSLELVLGKDFKYILNDSDSLVSQSNQTYAYARIFKLRYQLKYNYDTADIKAKLWESEFLKFIKTINTTLVSFVYSTSRSLEDEIMNNITFDTILVAITFTLITIFATALMSIKSNMVTSPGLTLPSAGIFAALFGVTSATGLLSMLGYPGCNLIYIIPFLVIGIGIDDMFIIYSSFVHTSKRLETHERISLALEKIGVSITITSLTDFTAFIVGTLTSFKSVRIFCVYAALSIIFCYFYQLTFFCGWLVIHSNRIKANRNTLIWCIKHQPKEKYQCEMDKYIYVANNENDSNYGASDIYNPTTISIDDNSSFKSFIKTFTKKLQAFYKFLICEKYGKCIVGFIFIIYLSFSIWNVLQIKEGINLSDLVSGKSYFKKFTDNNFGAFKIEPPVMLVVYEPIDYGNAKIRQKINDLLDETQNIDGIDENFRLSWIDFFNNELKGLKDNTERTLKQITNTSIPFSNDIVLRFNQTINKTQIIASRFYVKYSRTYFNSLDAKPMNALKDECTKSGLPILAYGMTFKYFEQFEQTTPNMLQAFVVAVEAMYFITLIFIPDLVAAICIVFSMISIMTGLVGFMNFWNLSLSSITMIEVIMCVGFCIDFSAHITHAFIAGVGKGTRNERAYRACIRTGIPIFNSALSSIIGVCVLAFSDSYIFISFFKTMFIVMILGVITSMFFLPVLLSLVGPHWRRHYNGIELHLKEENKFQDRENSAKLLIQ